MAARPTGISVDGGPHPNPRKAAEGYRLRVLAIDEPAAEVVRRIFATYLDGQGDRAIANVLNRDGIPCPSAHRREQNRHRLADGWQASAVRAILDNPRYTGYAFFGRWTKQEVLLDPEDLSAGHAVRFRRSEPDRIVRSRKPAHPAIVSVETFTEAALRRRSRAAGGLSASRKLERGPQRRMKHVYALRGRVHCGHCSRRIEGTPRQDRIYYRCAARTLVPSSPLLKDHPKNVYLPEAAVLEPLNEWIGGLFHRDNRDATVAALLASQGTTQGQQPREALQKRLTDAETRLRRLTDAITAGADPAAFVESINEAKAQREAAQAELQNAQPPDALNEAEIHAMIDYLGDVGRTINRAEPEDLRALYESLNLEMTYLHEEDAMYATIRPGRRDCAGVRGGNRTRARGIRAQDACSCDRP